LAKGIRVNQLAKELGVESKVILTKCRDEGLADKVVNHMSMISLGLAETVREWFAGGGGVSTAVETAAAVDVATKPRRTARKKKDGTDADSTDTHEAPVAEAPALSLTPVEPVPVVDEPEVVPPSVVIPEPIQEIPAPAAPEVTPVETPAEVPAIAAVAPAPPAPIAPPAIGKAPTPAVAPPAGDSRSQQSRPTITLSNRGTGPSVVERKAVVIAPKLMTLEPAKISGPTVVRVEKPDNVPAPRARRPAPGQGSDAAPQFAQARPQAGRGVRPAADDDEETIAKKKAAASAKSGRTLSQRRRGPDGRRGDAVEKLREFTEQDLEERRTRLNAAASSRAAFNRHIEGARTRGTHIQAKTAAQSGAPVDIEEPITVKNLSAALGIKSNDIVKKLFLQGISNVSINSNLDHDTAEAIAMEYGVELHIHTQATMEDRFLAEFEAQEADPAKMVWRPPVVTILGHVDHGKTSLLDKIRKANVAAGEAGGITQHTAAWMVQLGEKKITFIDTPGHQAFTAMRARGANMTDVVVLVVGAAEGVQPQTIESISHAKAAGVPIVVALNKIDRPDANVNAVLGQLAGNGLNPVEYGGETEVVRTSAITGQGIPELLEILDLQSQIMDLKADPTAPARGTVIESRMDAGLGPVATVLVQNGTLKVGDVVICGPGYGRVRMLLNDLGTHLQEAGPSTPVVVSGLSSLPSAGDKFFTMDDIDEARKIAEERQLLSRQASLAGKTQVTLENLFDTMKATDIKTINLIIKGDVQGSVETLQKTVTEANTDEVKVRVIHAAVGGISESDVELADASKAVIIGFHVVPDEAARAMAEQRRVEIRLYRVIYEIFDDLKKALSGLLEPEVREKLHGHAEIRKVYKVSKVGNIGGCFVTDGHIQRGSKIRLSRGGIVITDDLAIESLKRLKDDAKEVKAGLECGIKLAGYDDIKEGDILEAYIREMIQRTL
jgi:translation initiation factor IF-2